MITQKPFYFIRHGETDWNRKRIFMGQKDIPLNANGVEQAWEAAKNLATIHFASIAASPLKRAAKTAEIIAEITRKPIALFDNLKECAWGAQEGQGVDDGTLFQNWFEGQGHDGAETVREFEKRVLLGLNQALHLPEPVLVVAHGGVYAAIRERLSLPAVSLENCRTFYHRPPEHPTHPWFASEAY